MRVSLTMNAVAAVKVAMARSVEAVAGLRLMAEAGAGDGVTFKMHLESCARDGDAVLDAGGVAVFIDPRSALLADGFQIDFVTSPKLSGFVFEEMGPLDNAAASGPFSPSAMRRISG